MSENIAESEGDIGSKNKNQPVSSEEITRWTKRGYEDVKKLEGVPGRLKQEMEAALNTPQFGPYHNEGPRMAAHIGLMSENIESIQLGTFDFQGKTGFPDHFAQEAKSIVTRALERAGPDMRKYAYLHDIKKIDCMNIDFIDKHAEKFERADWEALLAEAGGDDVKVSQILNQRGVKKIGYRQGEEMTGGESKEHGHEALVYLEELAKHDPEIQKFVSENHLIIQGVALHEIHFQVFNNARSAKQYFSKLIENSEGTTPRFSEAEIDFIFAACFIDIAASRQPDGGCDFSGFFHMLEARDNYERIMALSRDREQAGKPLSTDDFNALMKVHGPAELDKRIISLDQKKMGEGTLAPEKLEIILNQLDTLLASAGISPDKKVAIEQILRGDNPSKALGSSGYGKLAGEVRKLTK